MTQTRTPTTQEISRLSADRQYRLMRHHITEDEWAEYQRLDSIRTGSQDADKRGNAIDQMGGIMQAVLVRAGEAGAYVIRAFQFGPDLSLTAYVQVGDDGKTIDNIDLGSLHFDRFVTLRDKANVFTFTLQPENSRPGYVPDLIVKAIVAAADREQAITDVSEVAHHLIGVTLDDLTIPPLVIQEDWVHKFTTTPLRPSGAAT